MFQKALQAGEKQCFYIDNSDSSVFVDVAKAKNRIEELRKLMD